MVNQVQRHGAFAVQRDAFRFGGGVQQGGEHPFPVVDEEFPAIPVQDHPQGQLAVLRGGFQPAQMGDVPAGSVAAAVKEQFVIFIPFITPDVVGSVVWKQFFNTQGAMNQLLALVGLQPVNWLTTPATALGVLAFVELWKHVGLYTIIFLTNYQLIDRTMYEAAWIDGANAWQTYRYITLPALKPAFTLNAVYSVIQFLKTYTVARIITFGGPNYATNFLSYYAYSKYEKMDFGSATAIATFLFLFVIVLTMLGSRLGRENHESE